MLRFILRQIFSLPLALRDGVFKFVLRKKRIRYVHPQSQLPVAGLDERALQWSIFTLRQESEDPNLVQAWLTTTQLTQVVMDRLLRDMKKVESNFAYWKRSMGMRHHNWLMFIQRGPFQTFQRLLHLFKADRTSLASATDLIEHRLIALNAEEKLLLTALADVYEAATVLRLDEGDLVDDFARRTFVRVQRSLTLLSNVLRMLTCVTAELQDAAGAENRIGGVAPNVQIQLDALPTAEPNNNAEQSYNMDVLLEGIAKVNELLHIDLCSDPSHPLSGSNDMYRWAESVKFALETHVVTPLGNLTEEIFSTFHTTPGVVSRADYELSKASLERMLKDFKDDNLRRQKTSSEASEKVEDSLLDGMDVLMRTYESELKQPLINAISGQLARALLIQVQKLKVDTESAMLELDQILRANELNVALIAAIPAILAGAGILYFLFNFLINRSGPDPYKSTVPCRLALVELQRALERSQEAEGEDKEAAGMVFYRLERLYRACWNVFENRNLSSSQSEWPSLRSDFLDLYRQLPLHQKSRICERMRLNYSVFQIE